MNALSLYKKMRKKALYSKNISDDVAESIAKNLTIYTPTDKKKEGKIIYNRHTLMDQVNSVVNKK